MEHSLTEIRGGILPSPGRAPASAPEQVAIPAAFREEMEYALRKAF
jgi:hypothetical protein